MTDFHFRIGYKKNNAECVEIECFQELSHADAWRKIGIVVEAMIGVGATVHEVWLLRG